jgi:hypothetical protein
MTTPPAPPRARHPAPKLQPDALDMLAADAAIALVDRLAALAIESIKQYKQPPRAR